MAKQGGLGELSGLCKVYRPKRRPAEGQEKYENLEKLNDLLLNFSKKWHLKIIRIQILFNFSIKSGVK